MTYGEFVAVFYPWFIYVLLLNTELSRGELESH